MGFNHKIDCPICQNERRDCRQNTETGMIHCHSGQNAPEGYIYKGEDRHGFGMYFPGTHQEYTSFQNSPEQQTRRQKKKHREKIWKKTVLQPEERHAQIKAFLSQLTELKENHKQDLEKRGINPNWAFGAGFRSINKNKQFKDVDSRLPGIQWNKAFYSVDGYICPAPGSDKKLKGFQIKSDNSDFGKYLWTKTKAKDENEPDATAHLSNGELPIAFWGWEKGKPLNLIEGILKPAVCHYRFNGNWVGAAGGHFLGSKEQIRKGLEDLEATEIHFYPDAGALANPQVRHRDLKNLFWLASLGLPVYVADWGQLDSKEVGDFDELEEIPTVNWLSLSQYRERAREWEPENWDGVIAKLEEIQQNRKKFYQIKVRNPSATQFYEVGSIPQYQEGLEFPKFSIRDNYERQNFYKEAFAKGWKYLLDTSGTGTGKSFAVGNLEPTDFFPESNGKIFYLVKSSRNPATEGIEKEYKELPARNNGFVEENEKTTPLGNPYRRRPKENEKTTTQSNCHWSHRFQKLAEKNREDVGLCNKCPFFDSCKSSSGDGYGFLSQIKKTLGHSKIRANPLGLSPEMVEDNCVGIIDEYSQSLDSYKELVISFGELHSEFYLLKEIDQDKANFIKSKILDLFGFLSTQKGFGFTHKEIIEQLEEPPEWLYEVVEELKEIDSLEDSGFLENENYDDMISKSWLREFLEVWGNLRDGAFSSTAGKLSILVRDQHISNILENLDFVIFQDATGSKKDLANKIGTNESNILEVGISKIPNLEIVNITGFGKAGKDRSKDCQQRINALVRHFKSEYQDLVGFIDFKDLAEKDWLNHFSDARGSNAYQEKAAVISIGIPYPHLGNAMQEYSLCYGKVVEPNNPDEEFQEFFGEKVAAEIIQEIGRIRANRRQDEELSFYIVGDFDNRFLANLGYKVQEKSPIQFTVDAATRGEKTAYKISKAAEQFGENLTQIAKGIGQSRSNVSKAVKKLGGLKQLKQLVNALFEDKTIEPPDEESEWLINQHIPNEILDGELENVWNILDDLKSEYGMTPLQVFLAANMRTKGLLIGVIFIELPKKVQDKLLEIIKKQGVVHATVAGTC